jgi:GTP pyrophosphokinase
VVVTGRARAAIRRAARDELRRQYRELGHRLLVAQCEKAGITLDDAMLEGALDRFSAKSADEVLVSIGRGELGVIEALQAIAPGATAMRAPPTHRPYNRHDHGRGQDGWFNLKRVMGLKFYLPGGIQPDPARGSVPIRGFNKDLPVTFQEGGAVPGDRIVGVLVPKDGIKIFQIHSPLLKDHESEKWIDVTWDIDPEHPERFPARINITAVNQPGSLAEIAQVIGERDGNIDNLRMVHRAADFTEMLIEVDVWDLSHLNEIISELRMKSSVSSVERVFE